MEKSSLMFVRMYMCVHLLGSGVKSTHQAAVVSKIDSRLEQYTSAIEVRDVLMAMVKQKSTHYVNNHRNAQDNFQVQQCQNVNGKKKKKKKKKKNVNGALLSFKLVIEKTIIKIYYRSVKVLFTTLHLSILFKI